MTSINRTLGSSPSLVAESLANQVSKGKGARRREDGMDAKTKAVDVDLSGAALIRNSEMQKAKEIALATPEIREDRVAELRNQIQSGNYKTDSTKIADGILREALLEQLALGQDD
jgi:flagellar biosynthesis anti-sigma factor FlgM